MSTLRNLSCASPEAQRRLSPGLCIHGHLTSEIGLGEAARLLSQAGDSARLPLSFFDYPLPGRDHEHQFRTKLSPVSDRKASLFVFGLLSVDVLGYVEQAGRMNILYPFWELPHAPQRLQKNMAVYEEFWAPTAFVAECLRNSVKRPVAHIPNPVRTPALRPSFRRNGDVLTVFSFFDTDSYVARKNPMAALRAFSAAFAPSRRDVRMIVKVRGLADNGERAMLRDAAKRDPRIELIDKTLSRAQMNELMQSVDIFLSLHRSEGFGLGPAEALASGKVVVATDFGGTRDFIDERTGFPVSYKTVDVKTGEYPDYEGQYWAEPSLDHAVALLQEIDARPDLAFARSSVGFDRLKVEFSFAHVGALMRERLSALGLLED